MTAASAAAALAEAVSRLPPVSLEAVLATAELQTRVDRKYVVPLDLFVRVLGQLEGELSALQIGDLRLFRYESVYFDTPELATYRLHAHGRRRRIKIRTRAYLDSGECLLEFKRTGGRGETVKERHPYRLAARHELDADASALARERLGELGVTTPLTAVLTTAYHRTTLVDRARGSRVTCDVNLRFEGRDRTVGPLDDFVLVESKTVGAGSPVDRALRRAGSRPVSLSKYCVGMAVLDPALPANRWNRELRRHFGWAPAGARWPSPAAPAAVASPTGRPRT
ncbi:polyphosphate polymerase domain-containing protein [Nocardioides pyridinolyticus]